MLGIQRKKIPLLLTCAVSAAVLATSATRGSGQAQTVPKTASRANVMSPAGQRARGALRTLLGPPTATPTARAAARPIGGDIGDEEEDGGPGPLEDGGELPGGNQGELTIAIDDSGRHVVVGFNDFRGFLGASGALSISGFMWSDDGGKTFVDGGRLPITTGTVDLGGTLIPQVFGDPDIKYLGACNFIYTSIVIAPFGTASAVQTMGFHRSTDCGHTWEGPFIIDSASNPNGSVDDFGNPVDAADKEQIDVDRATGRVIVSWTNFSEEVEISSSYSDNVLAPVPTWSPRVIVAARPDIDGQASTPRFGPVGSKLAYTVWETSTPTGLAGISFARSTDNGASFAPPLNLDPGFFFPDQVLGNDRIHWFPTLAVDRSHGRHRGTVYVAYGQNNSRDGGDVVVQTSTDDGKTFGRPVFVSARPGADRSQWFPYITTNDRTGRALLFYYDQGIADSGDLAQVSFTYSDDGGQTWAAPRPLSPRPFHAGWGNDANQPNLGDYNQAVVNRAGDLLAAYATTHQVGFRDGEPASPLMTVPEPTVSRASVLQQAPATTVDLRAAHATEVNGFSNGNGFLDSGERAQVSLRIRNYVTNPMSARTIHGALALVESKTPGAHPVWGITTFPTLAPGESESSVLPIVLQLDPGFDAGRDVTLAITVFSLSGLPMNLEATLHTGTPVATPLIAETFDGVAPGALPPGWIAAHGAGSNTIRWTTSNTFCGSSSNAAFHVNANDGATPTNNGRWERLISPAVIVPADADWVEVELDVCTDTEDEPALNVQAYDGLFLRVFDGTPGDLTRSVLVEAFEQDFTTGGRFGYPKHFPRSGNPFYFEDMSAWAGDSGGIRHVKIRLPGMAGTTAQLRFEFAQDEISTCADVRPGHSCGVLVDNVKLTSFKAK
jgi:hypothetical protein